MPLNKAVHILKKLAESDPFFNNPAITCWEKKQGRISIYFFAIIFSTADDLILGYKEIRDHVAISFQSQELENSAERWNLYLFYLVAGHVSHTQKQLIEHDKFSTRKIVCSGITEEITDEVISGLIGAELFDFKIEKRKPTATNLETLLIQDFPKVATALKTLGSSDTVDALKPLLKHLNNG